MSKRGLIAFALLCVGIAFAYLSFGERPEPQANVQPAKSGEVRHEFLDDLQLDDGAYAVVLHDLATGNGPRAVLDESMIRAAQGRAFYTDDPSEQAKMLLLSLVFLSPPGMPPDSGFASIVRNKEVVEVFRCYVPYCNGSYEGDPAHARDMAGLIEASQPIEYVTESFRHHDKARVRHFRLLQDDAVVFIDPPDLPAPGTIVYPERLALHLPALLLEADPVTNELTEPFDEAEYAARFRAAFEHAYPDTEAYRLGPISFSTMYQPQFGWPVVSDEIDGYLRNTADELIGIDGLIVKEPTVSIELYPTMAQTLLGEDPFSEMPDFAREPENLSQRLDDLALQVLGRPCPDCFKIELPVASVDDIKVSRRNPVTYLLSYTRVLENEPAAQQ